MPIGNRSHPLEADLGFVSAEEGGIRDTRYPRVRCEEVFSARPDMIILPVELFFWDAAAETVVKDLLKETPAVRNGRIHRGMVGGGEAVLGCPGF